MPTPRDLRVSRHPQTRIVEALGAMAKRGELTAEFVNVESEFAALSVAIGAEAAGARACTATASQGLLYSDAMSQRDAGCIQLYAETDQEAADLHIQAFRIAEELSNPVLPPCEPRQVLGPDDPVPVGAMVGPDAFTEVRYLAFERMRGRWRSSRPSRPTSARGSAAAAAAS